MLCHIDHRTAIFTAQRQALQHAQDDQDGRSQPADAEIGLKPGIGGKKPDDKGGGTHDQDGEKEGIFAADQIAQSSEEQCTKGADKEAGGEGQQGEDVARRFRKGRKELVGNDRGKRAIEIEIIPFKDGACG